MITTAFFTHFLKSDWLRRGLSALAFGLALGVGQLAHGQTPTEISQVRTERVEDEVLVSAQVAFELPNAVEEAMLKGIPMYFVVQADEIGRAHV